MGGITNETVHLSFAVDWSKEVNPLLLSDAKRLRQLEEENARLKRLVGEQALDIVVLKDVISKNF